jgi:succinylarginine dihydrolase
VAFGDEGAANHMRFASTHGEPGLEVFVYGVSGGAFPARQHLEASRAVARLHGLDPERTMFVEQSPDAIAAGAFHNDVVAVANERVLFTHELAFAERDGFLDQLASRMPEVEIVEVPSSQVPIGDAIRSYLFNSQLVTPPDGAMTLVAPTECRETPSVAAWIERHLASNGAIRRVEFVDVRQSMANGGGPACLRLRVACDPQDVDPRFMVDEAKLDLLAKVIGAHWPEQIAIPDLQSAALIASVRTARSKLLEALNLNELLSG